MTPQLYKDLRKPAKEAWQEVEDSLQKKCAEWLKKALKAAGLKQELFYHVPSEGVRKPQYRAKLKLMGFRAGISDVVLILKRGEYSGVYCELKKAKGSPSKDQKDFLDAVAEQGFLAVVINDFDTFVEVFNHYINELETPKP